jgi:hypothetical protein
VKPEQAAESPKATFALAIEVIQAGLNIPVCGLAAYAWMKLHVGRLHSRAHRFHSVECRALCSFMQTLQYLIGFLGVWHLSNS